MPKKRVLIIGCGMAGPSAALGLKRAGFDPVIYEAYPGPGDTVGSFLGLTPNGQDVLKTFGIDKQVLADGFLTHGFRFANGKGKVLGIVPSDTVTIKRGELTKGVREEAARQGVPIEYGKRLKDIEVVDDNTVMATFEDGTKAQGNVLIGCDGIHSRTRAVLFPDAPEPNYTELLSCGAIATDTGLPPSDEVCEMIFGKKAFFSYLVKPSGEVFWFTNFTLKQQPAKGELEAKPQGWWHDLLQDLFKDDQPLILDIIKKSRSDILGYPIFDIATIPNWHKGPVCIIGDAAHAPSPSAGQGASLALEDGVVLAKCLRDIPDTNAALAKFVELRKERAERLVAQSRRNGSRKAPTNALSRWLRDLLLPIFLKRSGDATRWMYSYHVDWNEKIEP